MEDISNNLKDALISDGEELKDVKVFLTERMNGADFVMADLYYEDGSEMEVSFVIYDDGTWFSPYDWQGYMPNSIIEVGDIEWMVGITGRKAIMMDGQPRIMW